MAQTDEPVLDWIGWLLASGRLYGCQRALPDPGKEDPPAEQVLDPSCSASSVAGPGCDDLLTLRAARAHFERLRS